MTENNTRLIHDNRAQKPQLPPYLIIKFRLHEGEEQFEWGVTSGIPMLGLLGALCRAQMALNMTPESYVDEYPQSAFILVYEDKQFTFACDPVIPLDPLIAMIEVIKEVVRSNITKSPVAQVGMQRILLGVDGRPMRG